MVPFLQPQHSLLLPLAAQVSIVSPPLLLYCHLDPTTPLESSPNARPLSETSTQIFFSSICWKFVQPGRKQNVLSSLVRDRPAYQPGIPPTSDPAGAEGALRRRGRRFSLSPYGSDRADHQRWTTRQVSFRSNTSYLKQRLVELVWCRKCAK